MLIFLVGVVSAADNDTVCDELAVSDIPADIVSEDETGDADVNSTEEVVIQNASFDKVSKSNYLKKDYFEVSLLDENGTGLSNKSVYFTVADKLSKYAVTDENGTAKVQLNFAKGIYTINFVFNETGYNPVKGSKKILLLSKPVSTIKGSNLKGYAGIKSTYKVTLKADGIPLSGRVVTFKFNKHTYTRKTNSKGVASITIYLKKGIYKISYSYKGEENIKSSKSNSKITLKLIKNPYKTKYRTVLIDADGGFTKAFLKDVANKLRKAGWKVIVKGIGPNQHSINYKKVYKAVYMPFYNGLCAATIQEMTYGYYGGVIKSHGSVITPAWYTDNWTSAKMSKYRNDITKIKFLKRAWDDNFSPASYKGLSYPAKFMTNHKIRYCVGDTSYKIVEQFLYGGWVKHH